MIITVIFLYFGLVLLIGLASHKLFRGTGEDYFVASRTIGPFILLMSLFGTHMTAFAILGASGQAYHKGVGVFALMASSSVGERVLLPIETAERRFVSVAREQRRHVLQRRSAWHRRARAGAARRGSSRPLAPARHTERGWGSALESAL